MSVTVAVITHDRLEKLKHILYVISEQTVQPDKVEVYYSGYGDELDSLQDKYQHFTWSSQPDKKDWGHDKRAKALERCETDWIVTMNDDDQYPFVFLEFMLQHAKVNPAGIVYCDFCTRTNPDFFIEAKLERGHITNGCMLISKETAHSVPYEHRTYAGDWFFVEECIRRGVTFSKLNRMLFFAY
jgi:hypothetical protein